MRISISHALLFAGVQIASACLCEQTAYGVADNFEHMFRNYTNKFAESVLSPDFTDQTDSVGWLMNNGTECPHPMGSLTFPTLQSLKKAQSQQPNIPWQNLEVYWNCERVFVRWVSRQTPQHVQGIAILLTEKNPKNDPEFPYLIKTVHSEFNTGAWLVNLGGYQGVSPVASCS